jgi:hypothetical protein
MKHIRIVVLCSLVAVGCNKHILDEHPTNFLNSGNILTNQAGFETAITALYAAARNEHFGVGDPTDWDMLIGTDMYTTGDPSKPDFVNYNTFLTPTNSVVQYYWNWAYLQMLPRANYIIKYASSPTASFPNDSVRNTYIAEAKFFRAYTFNVLANLYGGVPIADSVYSGPKLDFTRASRTDVLHFAENDLLYAAQYLPAIPVRDGRVPKAAANHLLSEVYISLGQYDSAIASASAVINDGLHHLMTSRFGSKASSPGDVYSDLFRDHNQNKSTSGNTETIWAYQFEYQIAGGGSYTNGNSLTRGCGPVYWSIKDPKGSSGMVICDSLGRPVGWVRGNNYWNYTIWTDSNDIRNSVYNIRRKFYYNNPSSSYFGQLVDPATSKSLDTMFYYYPFNRKIEGNDPAGAASGVTFVDFYVMRLAETYLLRAEAYLQKGDLVDAAADINVVRSRAHASPVAPADVNIDYILDERARELSLEEPRRRTLVRMGKLVERVKEYNLRTGNNIQDFHRWWPIPQTVIDANSGAVITQNPGY